MTPVVIDRKYLSLNPVAGTVINGIVDFLSPTFPVHYQGS
jgi:hypothetical protein